MFVIRNIFTTFKYRDDDFYLQMYSTYVRPILEYASQVWSPVLKLNIDRIENVQRYYTRRILRRDNLSYLGRINHLELETLEHRRVKADLVLYFKMVNNISQLDINGAFRHATTRRGHNKQLSILYCRTEKRKLFWSNRLVRNWNILAYDTVNSSSVYHFKRSLWLAEALFTIITDNTLI